MTVVEDFSALKMTRKPTRWLVLRKFALFDRLRHAPLTPRGSESGRKPAGDQNPAPAVEAERGPRRLVLAGQVDWTALSPEATETLRTVALRIALGRSFTEVAEETGLTRDQVATRLRQLREEIRAQLGA
jgi:DNA-directed RNA polymerase specialized sigma24 family protein